MYPHVCCCRTSTPLSSPPGARVFHWGGLAALSSRRSGHDDLVAAGPPCDIPQRPANQDPAIAWCFFIAAVVCHRAHLLVFLALRAAPPPSTTPAASACVPTVWAVPDGPERGRDISAPPAPPSKSAARSNVSGGSARPRTGAIPWPLDARDPEAVLAVASRPSVLTGWAAGPSRRYLQATGRQWTASDGDRYEQWIPGFVHDIDRLVAHGGNLRLRRQPQRMFQIALGGLAILPPAALFSSALFVLVIRPWTGFFFTTASRRMAGDDFPQSAWRSRPVTNSAWSPRVQPHGRASAGTLLHAGRPRFGKTLLRRAIWNSACSAE